MGGVWVYCGAGAQLLTHAATINKWSGLNGFEWGDRTLLASISSRRVHALTCFFPVSEGVLMDLIQPGVVVTYLAN